MAVVMVKVKNEERRVPYIIDDCFESQFSKHKWCTDTYGYAVRNDKGKKVILHRLIMNAQKGQIVDHINGDITDNRMCNLRFVTKSQNAVNSKKRSTNTTGYRGVEKNGNRFVSRIWKDNKQIYIGIFKTKEEAALAYNEYAIKLHGEYARLNEIQKEGVI